MNLYCHDCKRTRRHERLVCTVCGRSEYEKVDPEQSNADDSDAGVWTCVRVRLHDESEPSEVATRKESDL